MTSLSNNNLLGIKPNTIKEVRKEYGLDEPGILEQAIDILHDWIQKQEHFVKKDYSRDYLERVIISAKGSVEKAKRRMDKICTMRTMVPSLFEKCHAINDFPNLHERYINLTMPVMTDDNYRIFIAKLSNKKISSSVFREGFQYSVLVCEYLKRYDYTHGYYVILDARDANVMDIINSLDIIDLRNVMTLYTNGYGLRLKAIYVLSNSSLIGAAVDILKQVVSAKIGQRISILKTLQSLHQYLPKRLLSEEYGGELKSMSTLYKEWSEELSLEQNVAYMKEMKKACTNEELRRSDKFNEEYLGMPGSFKILTFD